MTYKVVLYLDEEATLTKNKETQAIIDDLVSDEFIVIIRNVDDSADAIRQFYHWLDSEDCILTSLPELIFSIGFEVFAVDDNAIAYINCIAEIG